MKKNNRNYNGGKKRLGGINGYALGHMLSSSIAHHGSAMLKDCNENWFLKMLDHPEYYKIQWISDKKIVITMESINPGKERNYIIRETDRGAVFSFPGFDENEVNIRKFYRR